MTGQDIVTVAQSFHDQLSVTGLVLTKLDGDSRGGGILSVRAITNVPVKFVGQGEKIDDLDIFYPSRMADRILGMGDIMSFVEKASEKDRYGGTDQGCNPYDELVSLPWMICCPRFVRLINWAA